jgi:hypothetical protein
MPIFRYTKQIAVSDNDKVILKVVFPDNGTSAHHIIDTPGPDDKERLNEFEESLGKGIDLKKERTIISTKAFNLDSKNDFVKVNYLINDEVIFHVNLKNEDKSPAIKLTLTFI